MKHSPEIVTAFFKTYGIPEPSYELRFAPPRRWRMDLAWPEFKVFLEIQGGLFVCGRHNNGAAMLKEFEKINTASGMGWRVLYCQPKDLLTEQTAKYILTAMAQK